LAGVARSSANRRLFAGTTAGGEIADIVLAAAYVAGVDQVLRIGGAQAIAAMAFGTEQVARIDKIAAGEFVCGAGETHGVWRRWYRKSACVRPKPW
jgi:histidinol dehydrogenase